MSLRRAVSDGGVRGVPVWDPTTATGITMHHRNFMRLGTTLLGAIALFAIFVGAGVAATSTATFGFDVAPPAPQSFQDPHWDVQVHSRDVWTQTELESMQVAHGADCGAPPASHENHTYEGAVFNCKNHVMTAINATGYGVIYLTPDTMVDFSTGEAVIKWDMSTFRSSDRDWMDVWITPWADNMALPLEEWIPDLTGNPRNAIHIRMDGTGTSGPLDGRFRVLVVKDGVETSYGLGAAYNDFLVPDSTRRDTFELRISKTSIKLSMPAYGQVLDDVTIPALDWSTGIVQWGHHSYNPKKDGYQPGTFHWDNMSISPSIPFTMIHADRRYTTNGQVNFDSPAPANAFLRFSSQGGKVEIDDGSGFKTVLPQSWGDGFRAASFFVPIRQGATSVQVRMSKGSSTDGFWFAGPFYAKDFAIWAQTGSAPAPASTSTPTQVSATPTATSPAQGTTTAVPTATTAAPTNTPTPIITVPVTTADKRISWQGGNWYLHGANLPWYNWACDFGCGSNGGVSSAAVKSALGTRFAQAKANGIRNIRWWMLEGDAWQISRDAQGNPTGINPAVYTDIDAALLLAEQNDLYYDFVLFNSPTAIPSEWVNNPTQRAKLAQVLGPLFAKYKNNPRVLSWEVFNEPEWDIWNGSADQAAVQATVKAIADSVHINSSAKVTVGSAMLDGLGMWVGLGLDYYRAHWYDYMSSGNWCANCTDYATVKAKYNLDKPLVIGEMYAGSDIGALARFESLYNKGYAGAFAWSLFPEKTSDGMTMDLAASKTFSAAHSDIGPKGLSSPAPTGTPTATATATSAAKPTFTVTTKLSKTAILRNQEVKVTATFKASSTTKALVDIEIFGPDGTKVFQKYFDNQSFTAGGSKTFSTSWRAPIFATPGTYVVKVAVFQPGWGQNYLWIDQAATFTVR